jgi:hypothetical protein
MHASEGTTHPTGNREQLLAFWDSVPAVLYDRRLEVLDSTPLARALSPAFAPGVNLVRFSFLSPQRRSDHPRWREMSGVVTGLLRESLDQHDADRPAQRIIGELSAKSREFSEIWADPEARPRTSGLIEFEGTEAGDLRVTFNVLRVPGYDDNAVIVFAPADDESRAAVGRLMSVAAAPSDTVRSEDGRAAR